MCVLFLTRGYPRIIDEHLDGCPFRVDVFGPVVVVVQRKGSDPLFLLCVRKVGWNRS